jgi:predicted glycoside hydrolase/deacetylase ChbG (UPF0249 family)
VKIIINADDYGYSDGICRGIRELFDCGAISNTTVMMATCGAVERCRRSGLDAIRGRAGVHLQLTSGRPLSSGSSRPSLVAPDGSFIPRTCLGQAATGDVLAEWRAQVEAFIDVFGVLPTHLDSHHGVHRLPNCAPAYFALAAEYGLPVRGGVNELTSAAAGIRGSDAVIYGWTTTGAGARGLIQLIEAHAARLPAHSGQASLEVVTHPGYNDAYLGSMSSLNAARELDLGGLLELADMGWLPNQRFQLGRYPSMA